jgi:hypothetical protein
MAEADGFGQVGGPARSAVSKTLPAGITPHPSPLSRRRPPPQGGREGVCKDRPLLEPG